MRALKNFWDRHRTLFWMFHSAWALTTGALVAYFSHERYQLVGWVALALAITWASTLYFGRTAAMVGVEEADVRKAAKGEPTPTLMHEVTSYLTRSMYQETLFFLLPFYAYSTVVQSPNVLFLILLGALAIFSCIDLPFDRWLRTKPMFGFAFFAIVAFAALNLLLPLVFGMGVRLATPAAAVIAILVSLPLVWRSLDDQRRARLKLSAAALSMAVITIGFPVLIPPVPLRLLSTTFSTSIERETLTVTDTLPAVTTPTAVGSTLVVVVHIFAPTDLPARVHLVWRRDDELLRTSRDVEVTAHATGFRAWDSWSASSGNVPTGDYEVVLETSEGRVIGEARLRVAAGRRVERAFGR